MSKGDLHFQRSVLQSCIGSGFTPVSTEEYRCYKNLHGKKLFIGTNTGRSGMTWTSLLLSQADGVERIVEPMPFEESFFRFITWHDLPIDVTYYFGLMRALITECWKHCDSLIYASPWVNSGLEQIQRELMPDTTFTVFRPPRQTIKSLINKGWYSELPLERGSNINFFSKYLANKHQYFSRIIPQDSSYNSSVGACSIYWNQAYKKIFDFGRLNYGNFEYAFLNDINSDLGSFLEFSKSIGVDSKIDERKLAKNFKRVNEARSYSFEWTDLDEEIFSSKAYLFYSQFLQNEGLPFSQELEKY